MFARVRSAAIMGIEAYPLEIETDISSGMPSFTIVGLPDASVSEARERVRTAIINSQLEFPYKRLTVNMAPAHIRKEGSSFDLPIAIGILAAGGIISADKVENFLIIGELSLNGKLRAVTGVLPIVALMQKEGWEKIVLPKENAPEAALMPHLKIYPADSLEEAVSIMRAEELFPPYQPPEEESHNPCYALDFSDVKAQETSKRALEVSAAGGHNLLMVGPPGSGKTMLARRVPSILPELSRQESLEITRIYSISGMLPNGKALITERPFRSPHHSASKAGLVGGGAFPRPGEVSLAHRGVLFLDELPEFDRNVLEVMRQPMEDGHVTISRANLTLTFPANFMLIASMNPCPCGFATDPVKECTCNPFQVKKYMMKISGPLLDRIDIHIEVPRLKYDELTNCSPGESSENMRKRVESARDRQQERFRDTELYCNADMNTRWIRKICKIPDQAKNLLKTAIEKLGLSARAYDRILKVSRTIADLADRDQIRTEDVAEAIQYRSMDRNLWG